MVSIRECFSEECFFNSTAQYNAQDLVSSETITNEAPLSFFENESMAYSYNALNQVVSSTDTTFSYDPDGNMVGVITPGEFALSLSYDPENRVSMFLRNDHSGNTYEVDYAYGGSGFLEAQEVKNGAAVNKTYSVMDAGLVLQERDGNNKVVREYTWGLGVGGGIGGLLDLKQGGQHYSYLYDGRGNVVSVIDSNQSVVAAYAYDPFGNVVSATGALEQPYQFSTKPRDEKTGLSYFGYRFYSPSVGRWITRDPLGEIQGPNLYEFVRNNPLNRVDAWGLDDDPLASLTGSATVHLPPTTITFGNSNNASSDDPLAPLVPPDDPLAPLVQPDDPDNPSVVPLVPPKPTPPKVRNPKSPCPKPVAVKKKPGPKPPKKNCITVNYGPRRSKTFCQ